MMTHPLPGQALGLLPVGADRLYNRLKDVRTWAIPDSPVKYKVIWFETDAEIKNDAEEKE